MAAMGAAAEEPPPPLGPGTEQTDIGEVLVKLHGCDGTKYAPLSQIIRGVAIKGWQVTRQAAGAALADRYKTAEAPWRLNGQACSQPPPPPPVTAAPAGSASCAPRSRPAAAAPRPKRSRRA